MIKDTQPIAIASNHHQKISPPNTNPSTSDHQARAWVHFQDQIEQHLASDLKINSSELIRYPQLATQLRQWLDFPLLKRDYTIDLQGNPDVNRRYYKNFIQQCFNRFYAELSFFTAQLTQWTREYGREPIIPIIEGFSLDAQGWIERCVINGLSWDIPTQAATAGHPAQCLDLHALFSIDRQRHIQVEDAILGSPLLALSIQSDQAGHKDQLFWYNLHTRRKGELTDAMRY
jgi:hypothetical protein